MSYNKTYSEIKTLLKTSERVGKTTMLKIARLAIKETLGDRVEIEDIKWDSKFLDLDADKLTEMMMSKAESAGTLPDQSAPELPVAEAEAVLAVASSTATEYSNSVYSVHSERALHISN